MKTEKSIVSILPLHYIVGTYLNHVCYLNLVSTHNISIYEEILKIEISLLIIIKYPPNLGPVVQSIVSLTTSLRRQLVKYMPTELSNTLLFFQQKNNSLFVILTF